MGGGQGSTKASFGNVPAWPGELPSIQLFPDACHGDFQLSLKAQKATLILRTWPLSLMRRRPTLPYTFAHSTIGPAGLNFRVRDGNGWNPRGKITAKSAVSH